MGGGSSASLAYDPFGRLKDLTASSATTSFAYDGINLIAEYDGSGTVLRRYVHGPGVDEPILHYEGSGTNDRRWLYADERGSVMAIADASGNVLTTNSYDEYGIPPLDSGLNNLNTGRFQYTGQAWLPELGLYYYKARLYSPWLGRFLQTDPIGYASGSNLYAYVGNDPINAIDPLGLCDENLDTAKDGSGGDSGCSDTGGGEATTKTLSGGPLNGQTVNAKPGPSPDLFFGAYGVGYYDFSGSFTYSYLDWGSIASSIGSYTPVLTGSFSSKNLVSNSKKLVRQWTVSGSTRGVVVQEIWSTINFKAGKQYFLHFFEAWPYYHGSWPFGNTDTFGLTSGNSSVSGFSVRGVAYYYDGATLPSAFAPGNVPQARDLPSSYTLPRMGGTKVGPITVNFSTGGGG